MSSVTGFPDFFLVGAPKCGTTALDQYLHAHPEIFMCPIKEVHYFGTDLEHRSHRQVERDDYLDLFRDSGDRKRVGEASALYLYSSLAATEICATVPDADIIVMLRNPVEAMYSFHSQLLFIADENEAEFARALAMEDSRKAGRNIPRKTAIADVLFYRDIVRYADQLQRYLDVFGEDRVHVIVFDDFKDDTAGTYRRVLEFLDVDPDFAPPFTTVNANKSARTHLLDSWIKTPPEWFVSTLRRLFPFETRMRLLNLYYRLNSTYRERPPMEAELRASLEEEFLPDVRRLGEMIGRDLTHWCA